MGTVAEPCMRKGFLLYEEMRKYLTIYEEAIRYMTRNLGLSSWIIY